MNLEPFLAPRGIAVIGASGDPTKLGYAVARNLIQGGYTGEVHLVNPRGGELFGRPLRGSLSAVPDPVDLAVVIVPAAAAPQALREVGQRGIKAAILTSGGFKETGAEGAALETEVRQACAEYGIRLIGPNCIGLLDTHLPLDTTFLPQPMPPKGGMAFLSHSGAFCAAVVDWSRGQGFGFSRLVSLGNQADVTETDLLGPIAADANTKVIALYLESISTGRRFIEEAQKASQQKPIVALKVGRSAAGQKAAVSHTGALAGSEAAYDAAFEKAGILRADTAEALFDWARALEACPLPAGKRMAVLTNAGGPGVIAADALAAHGLELASLAASTEQALGRLLPPAASVHNPVDMLAAASPDQYAESLRLLLADPGVDGALVILPPSPNHPTDEIAARLAQGIAASEKPALVNLMGAQLVAAARDVFHSAGIPVFPFPERAASALGALFQRTKMLNREERQERAVDKNALRSSLLRGSISAMAADELVAAYGIPTAPVRLARSPEEAATLAAEIGFPLVLKIASPDIAHKSDVGGVILNLLTPEAVADAYFLAIRNAQEKRPDTRIEGCHIQRQMSPGQEVIVGMARDPQFGALMMFGSGGVEVEGLKDVAFGLAPLTPAEARAMIGRTWAGKKLGGFRNIPAADQTAVIEALVRLSELACDHPEITEIEINPLRVLAHGAVAVDVRLKH